MKRDMNKVGYPFNANIIGFERTLLLLFDSSQPLLDSQ
jgi:hypothetical protein